MLAPLALAALLIGGIQTAIVVNDKDGASAQNDPTPVVEVQTVQSVTK